MKYSTSLNMSTELLYMYFEGTVHFSFSLSWNLKLSLELKLLLAFCLSKFCRQLVQFLKVFF